MAWVVDTSVVVDLVTGDPLFEPKSILCLQAHLSDGLVISPVTFVELGPSFSGDDVATEVFLRSSRIGTAEFWSPDDSVLAHRLWHQFQLRRRQQCLFRLALHTRAPSWVMAVFCAGVSIIMGSWVTTPLPDD